MLCPAGLKDGARPRINGNAYETGPTGQRERWTRREGLRVDGLSAAWDRQCPLSAGGLIDDGDTDGADRQHEMVLVGGKSGRGWVGVVTARMTPAPPLLLLPAVVGQRLFVLPANDPPQRTAIAAQGHDPDVAQLRVVQRDVLEPPVIVQRAHEEEIPLLPVDAAVAKEKAVDVGMAGGDDGDSA